MMKQSKIYDIAKKLNNIQNDCYTEQYLTSCYSLTGYYRSKRPCMHDFRQHIDASIMDSTNNYDELLYYIGNNDKLVYYRQYCNYRANIN